MSELFVEVSCRGHINRTHDTFVSVSTLGKFMEASSSGWSEDTQCVDDIVREVESNS